MDEKMLEIINLKSFSELTEAEKNEFRELFSSEEEFEALKQFYGNFEGYKKSQNYSTHYMTKGSLDELFASEYPNQGIVKRLFPSNKPFYMNPILQIAAAILVVLLVYNFNREENEKPQLASDTKLRNNVKKVQKIIQQESEGSDTSESKSNSTNSRNPLKLDNTSLLASNQRAFASSMNKESAMEDRKLYKDLNDQEHSSSTSLISTNASLAGVSIESDNYFTNDRILLKSEERKSTRKAVNNQLDLLDLLTPIY
jgi:hypothetical protein